MCTPGLQHPGSDADTKLRFCDRRGRFAWSGFGFCGETAMISATIFFA